MAPEVKTEHGDQSVFHFNARVGQTIGVGVDTLDGAHEPEEKIDGVDGLVHQGAAAVQLPRAAPSAPVVIRLRPVPFHVRVAHDDPAKPAFLQGSPRRLVGRRKAALKDHSHLDALGLGSLDDVRHRSSVTSRGFSTTTCLPASIAAKAGSR